MTQTWSRGPLLVVLGLAALVVGAWWGVVRGAPSSEEGERRSRRIDLSEVTDLVPGCTIDTCRVLARRDGFRFERRDATLVVVATPEQCAGLPAVGVHLVTARDVLWSGPVGRWCGDPVGGIETDTTGHAFLVFPAGAHTVELVVLAVGGDTVEDFGSFEHRFAGDGADSRDPDGDGAFEIVASVNDCEPDCATGRTRDAVFRWNGEDYVEDQ